MNAYPEKQHYTADDLAAIIAILRDPDNGCPWDKVQTHRSIRMNFLEEAYEAVDAIDLDDPELLCEELGDVLMQVVFHAQIEREAGHFTFAEVCDGVCRKLIFRHPHVFGAVHADTPDEVKQNWEDLKLKEKEKEHEKKRVLSGVPRTLPSLVKAYRISQKAASAGFDWETKEDIWSKVQEEISEVQAAMQSGDEVNKEEEFGDLLFALVNAARLYGVNAETALEKCNKKFISRFTYIEEQAEKQGLSLRELSLAEMENWWCEAKNKAKEKTE